MDPRPHRPLGGRAGFATGITQRWLAELPNAIVYPAETSAGLQALGKLAGWHHDSPFRVGINATWGSWYAYRVVALTDSDFIPTPPQTSVAPCSACPDKPCVTACPAEALNSGTFDLQECIAYRRAPWARCQTTRLARRAGLGIEKVTNLAVYCALAGLAGAKLLMFVLDFDYYWRNPGAIFSFDTLLSAGVYYGGFLSALAFAWFYMKRQGLPWLPTADVFAPGVALGHALGRVAPGGPQASARPRSPSRGRARRGTGRV